ncbi:MAG: chloride channel [Acidimicrobiaceae bacterium]|nr:chloride channel [Acidimicrobiaceae bacterium]
MPHSYIGPAAPAGGVPIAPSMGPLLEAAQIIPEVRPVDQRTVFLSAIALVLGVAVALIASLLTHLINLVTNIAFYGRWSTDHASPAGNHLGLAVVIIPVVGAILVGLMARYGSKAIRGHGIPEAMEQVLLNESRIPARITLLKPLSAAISIGTGGPFGAEGPIIATGGALGSLIGQLVRTTANERKTLLAAGAAAGMSATFGSPVSAVLLAVELLLFEYRPRSLIPVALATTVACGMRMAMVGTAPAFDMPSITEPGGAALALYIAIGAVMGLASVFVTRTVYAVEDAFERLPIHWMWWPALGAIAVGVVGFFAPRTMGVGYDNIERALSGSVPLQALATLTVLKFISWSISLGSGTSGGTLAPLFTIGGGLGALAGAILSHAWPELGIDPRIGALVGMAAMFVGASHALLASVVFAFETTRQPMGLLPLLGACSASYLISSLLMRHSIMTEKIARRGVRVSTEYGHDVLSHASVGDFATRTVATLSALDRVGDVLSRLTARGIAAHHGYPVLRADGRLLGVLTRTELLGAEATRSLGELVQGGPVVISDTASLYDAVTLMTKHHIGRLPVVSDGRPNELVGMLTRSDVLKAYGLALKGNARAEPALVLPWMAAPRT